MSNLEIAEANTLRLKARIAIRGLGLPLKIKEAVLASIDAVELPLHQYYKVNKEDTARAFVRKVMAGIDDLDDEKIIGEIKKCLEQKLTQD